MIFFEGLRKYNNVVHGIMERGDGSVNPFCNAESGQNVLRAVNGEYGSNYKEENLIFAEQIHLKNLFFCPSDVSGYIKLGVDGLISETSGHILVVKTADCVPILVYDPVKNRVGAIHAGRRGLLAGIIGEAMKFFEPSTAIVAIGPHIRKCCYNLNLNTKENLDKQWYKYLEGDFFDITKIAIDQLKQLGVKNIEDCGICTSCESNRFFCSRKWDSEQEDKPCFGSFIGLKYN